MKQTKLERNEGSKILGTGECQYLVTDAVLFSPCARKEAGRRKVRESHQPGSRS